MDSERFGYDADRMFGADPFRNGIDGCCAVHTCAGRYKRALTAVRDGDTDIQSLLEIMEESCLGVLSAGMEMARAWSRIYVEVHL